jgi:YHS domain-containing protein
MSDKYQVIAGMSLLALVIAGAPAQGQHHREEGRSAREEGASALPLCPVTGEPINFAVAAKTDEGPVFFCCKSCAKKYEKSPKDYAKGVAAQRELLAKRPRVQVTCPVSGEGVDPKFSIEHDGQKVFFCCSSCVAKFRKNPDKYKAALLGSYTYQTKCPVMGGDIDPQSFTTLASGLKVYFCCPGCEKKLYDHPEAYLPKLEAQGVKLNAGEMKHAEGHDGGGHDHGSHDDGDGGHRHGG